MPRTRSIAVVVGFLCVLAAVAHAGPCEEEVENAARVEVVIDWAAGQITVDPESIEIYVEGGAGQPNRVCWEITGLEKGQTLSIVGKADQEDLFPSLEREIKGPKSFSNSGRPNKAGSWSYELTAVENESGTEIVLDPVIIIRG